MPTAQEALRVAAGPTGQNSHRNCCRAPGKAARGEGRAAGREGGRRHLRQQNYGVGWRTAGFISRRTNAGGRSRSVGSRDRPDTNKSGGMAAVRLVRDIAVEFHGMKRRAGSGIGVGWLASRRSVGRQSIYNYLSRHGRTETDVERTDRQTDG